MWSGRSVPGEEGEAAIVKTNVHGNCFCLYLCGDQWACRKRVSVTSFKVHMHVCVLVWLFFVWFVSDTVFH